MPRMMGGMMGGRGMMGGGRGMAVSHAMAHSAMSMMGGGMSTSQQTGIPQLPAGMMHHGSIKNLDKGGSTAQKFTNAQVASVSSGMGIAGMMGGMMGGVMTFDYGDKFNRQDIKEMKSQGFNKMQINRFINKNELGDTRAGGRFQENLKNSNAKNSTAYGDLLTKFNTLQTQFDQLQNNQGSDNTSTGSSESVPQFEPQFEAEMDTPLETESAMPFGGGSANSINIGYGGSPYQQQVTVPQLPTYPQPPTVQQPEAVQQPLTSTTDNTGEQATNTSVTNPSGFTGYQPFTLEDYTPFQTPVAQNQQMYTSQGGQGFYGAPQVTPTNPFTGSAYELDENGLPQYNHIYGPGTTLPGQLLPNKQGGNKKPSSSAVGGL